MSVKIKHEIGVGVHAFSPTPTFWPENSFNSDLGSSTPTSAPQLRLRLFNSDFRSLIQISVPRFRLRFLDSEVLRLRGSSTPTLVPRLRGSRLRLWFLDSDFGSSTPRLLDSDFCSSIPTSVPRLRLRFLDSAPNSEALATFSNIK